MILAVLQARVSSSRLPGKVLRPILGKPMLELQIERIHRCASIDRLVVATSCASDDDEIQALCERLGVDCFRGSLDDVLDRFYQAIIRYRPRHVVRLTGDCPLMDPNVADQTILHHLYGGFDYTANAVEPTFPDGLDVEVFSPACLAAAWREARLPSEREHVTPFIYHHPERFRVGHYRYHTDLSHLRWTVDNTEDFIFVSRVFEALYPLNPSFGMDEILQLLQTQPDLAALNAMIGRNEGYRNSLARDVGCS